MTDTKEPKDKQTTEEKAKAGMDYRSSRLAWISILLAIAAWTLLLCFNGYVALAAAIGAAICGFAAMPRRSPAAKRIAITAIIAATVLVVVVSAYLVVIKIGLS